MNTRAPVAVVLSTFGALLVGVVTGGVMPWVYLMTDAATVGPDRLGQVGIGSAALAFLAGAAAIPFLAPRMAAWPLAAAGAGLAWLGLVVTHADTPDGLAPPQGLLCMVATGIGICAGAGAGGIVTDGYERERAAIPVAGLGVGLVAGALLVRDFPMLSASTRSTAGAAALGLAAVAVVAVLVGPPATRTPPTARRQGAAALLGAAVLVALLGEAVQAAALSFPISGEFRDRGETALLVAVTARGALIVLVGALLTWVAGRLAGRPAVRWVMTATGVGMLAHGGILSLDIRLDGWTVAVPCAVVLGVWAGAALGARVPWEAIGLAGAAASAAWVAFTGQMGLVIPRHPALVAGAFAVGAGLATAVSRPAGSGSGGSGSVGSGSVGSGSGGSGPGVDGSAFGLAAGLVGFLVAGGQPLLGWAYLSKHGGLPRWTVESLLGLAVAIAVAVITLTARRETRQPPRQPLELVDR